MAWYLSLMAVLPPLTRETFKSPYLMKGFQPFRCLKCVESILRVDQGKIHSLKINVYKNNLLSRE